MKKHISRWMYRGLAAGLMVAGLQAQAAIIQVQPDDFLAGAGLITFSEFPLNTVNPSYAPADYGGVPGDPNVTFGGYFQGQGLSTTPAQDCPGAAPTACITGDPTGPLSLDPDSPSTFITNDGANPTSPVLSGSPIFNGPIAALFDTDLAGVGFDGGFFDAVGSTGITAFARDGSLLGTIGNSIIGIEFLGLVTSDGSPQIAGVFLDLIGNEPAGFAIDNVRFGGMGEVVIPGDTASVPEPFSVALLGLGLLGLMTFRRRLNGM